MASDLCGGEDYVLHVTGTSSRGSGGRRGSGGGEVVVVDLLFRDSCSLEGMMRGLLHAFLLRRHLSCLSSSLSSISSSLSSSLSSSSPTSVASDLSTAALIVHTRHQLDHCLDANGWCICVCVCEWVGMWVGVSSDLFFRVLVVLCCLYVCACMCVGFVVDMQASR